MADHSSLLIFREKINNIDKNIIKLLADRKDLVLNIAQFKIENNQNIRDEEREKNMLKTLILIGQKNNLKSEYITQLFKLIIKESVSIQQNLLEQFRDNKKLNFASFSFLGSIGSYSHIASCKYAVQNFNQYTLKECLTFQEVISSVQNNVSDYAVLPIENTYSGIIDEVFNLLKKTNLFIIGEINIFINHCLLAIKKVKLNQIKTIYSHPQPFKQCSNFIKNFPEWRIKYTNSTTEAIQKIIKYNEITNAVLGSEIGSKIYNLRVLSKNLANVKKNITKFIVLHRNPIKINKKKITKTTLILITKQESKFIDAILLKLQEQNILVKKIISQKNYTNPIEKIFYIDIQANLSSKIIQNTLKEIKKITTFMKVLGCYPDNNQDLIVTE